MLAYSRFGMSRLVVGEWCSDVSMECLEIDTICSICGMSGRIGAVGSTYQGQIELAVRYALGSVMREQPILGIVVGVHPIDWWGASAMAVSWCMDQRDISDGSVCFSIYGAVL